MGNEVCLRIEQLKKSYGNTPVLNDISLEVKTGEVIVVIGPSGCGKSTLLRCINGLEDIQAGAVYLGDEQVRREGKNITALRQKIGMVFQSYDLFPHMSVIDNIILAPVKVQGKRSEKR